MVRHETHEDIELSEAQPFWSYFLNVLSGNVCNSMHALPPVW